MKKSLMLAAMLCLGAVAANTAPIQPTTNNGQQGTNPFSYQSLENYGTNTYYMESSTPTLTPVSFGAGSGLLFSVQCSSTAAVAGDFAMLFDSATSSGLTAATQGHALAIVYLATSTVAGVPVPVGASLQNTWLAPHGSVRFSNGLAGLKTGTGGSADNCYIEALYDSQINSVSH